MLAMKHATLYFLLRAVKLLILAKICMINATLTFFALPFLEYNFNHLDYHFSFVFRWTISCFFMGCAENRYLALFSFMRIKPVRILSIFFMLHFLMSDRTFLQTVKFLLTSMVQTYSVVGSDISRNRKKNSFKNSEREE